MATDKQQYDYTNSANSLQTPKTLDKDSHSSSITIQLPSTSATINHTSNDDHQLSSNVIDHHHHHHHSSHNYNHQRNSRSHHINSGSLLDHCYRHTVATRSFLFENANNSLTNSDVSNNTTTTDESPTPPPHYHEIPGIVPAYQGRTSGPPPSYDEVVNPNAPPPSYQSLYGQVREASKSSNGLVDLFRQLFLILIGTLGCTMIIGFLLLIPITMILVGIVYVNDCRAENIPAFLVIGGLVWIVKNILNCYNQFKKDSSTLNRPPPRRAPITSSTTTTTATATAINVAQSQPLNDRQVNDRATAIQNSQITAQNSTTSATTRTRTSSTVRNQNNVNRIRQPTLIGITSYKCESMLNYFLIVWFLAGCIVVYRIYEPDYDNPLSSSYCNRTVYLYAFWLMTSAFIIMAIILSCLCCLMASSLMSCNHIGR